jgi:hypothetical protein
VKAMSNELLYIVEGVDPSGRKFAGLYTKADADYLVASDRLNRVIGTRIIRGTLNSSTTTRLEK